MQTAVTDFANSISSLTTQLVAKENEVRRTSENFQRALSRKLDCESFLSILNIVTTFIQLGFNTKSLFNAADMALESPMEEEKKTKDKEKKSDSSVIKSFTKVQANVTSIVNSFNKLKKIRQTHGEDAAKLVLQKEEFDRMMEKYLDIPEAKPYIKTIHEYIDLINQRNMAIANYDSALVQYDNVQTEIELAEREAEDIQAQFLIDANPLRPVFIQYMSRTLQMVKSLVIETLYRMSRSLEYYTLSQIPLHFVDYRISTLEKQYVDLLSALNGAREERGAQSNFRRSYDIDHPAQLEWIKQGKPVWFYLYLNRNAPPMGPFANIQYPLLKTVECFLDGVTSTNPEGTATITIQHCGVSILANEKNKTDWTFVHTPRTISFEYNIASKESEAGQGDLTEGDHFMMLSPFAVWAVQIRPEDGMNRELDLSHLERVTLKFKGKGGVSPIYKSARLKPTLPIR